MQTIAIRQFNVQYNVPRSLDNPANVQRRLDQIVSQLLAQTLENQLAQWNDADGMLYFIEQLHFDLSLDPTHNDDRQLAIAWAGALYASIQRILSQSGMGVVCFRDRSTFIASFVEDLIQGRAWERWYYAEFNDLRSVSVSQAVLQVLTLDGDVGRDALLELTRRDSLERLMSRLMDTEVEAIATQCLLPPSPGVFLSNSYSIWIQELRSLLNRVTLTSIMARDVTCLYLQLLRQHPELGPDVNLARFIQDILHLRQTVMSLNDRSAFLAQLTSENWSEAFHHLGRSPSQPLLRVLTREVAGTDLVGLLQDLQVDTPATPTQCIRTAFGGIFLLVGAIADLNLYTFLQACPYPASQGISQANLLLWLMVLQCLGQENLEQAWSDRGVLAFSGLAQAPKPEWLADYAAQLTPEMHQAFGAELQAHYERVIRQPDRFMYPKSLSVPQPSMGLSLYMPLPEAWNDALGVMSAIVLQGFAARLGALAGSSPSYLSRNFLESEAEIWISEATIVIHFVTCPLQMVLKMAGFEHFRWQIAWLSAGIASPLENRQLSFNFD